MLSRLGRAEAGGYGRNGLGSRGMRYGITVRVAGR